MKKVFSVLLILLFASAAVAAQVFTLNESQLPSDKEFVSKYSTFKDHQKYSISWVPEWKFDVSRDSVIGELKDFDSFLSKQKLNSYDLQLLSAIVKMNLYNFDEINYSDVDEYLNQIKEKYPDEYRTWWITAFFYNGASPYRAFDEITKAEELRGGLTRMDNFVIDFLADYIYIALTCGMNQHANYALSCMCNFTKRDPESFSSYEMLKSRMIETSIENSYQNNEVWNVTKIDDKLYIESTLLGVSIKTDENQQGTIFGFENGFSYVILQSPVFKIGENNTTTTTLAIYFYAGKSEAEVNESMNRTVQKNDPNAKVTPLGNYQINDFLAHYYTYENPEIYNDERNGLKLEFLIFTVPYNEFSGISFERQVDFSNSYTDGNVKYFQFKKQLKRLDTPVSCLILLDSCNAVFEESRAWMESILNESIFE